jgi:hypothetical protein
LLVEAVAVVALVTVLGAAGFSRGLGAERSAAKLPEFCPAIGRLIGVVAGGGGGGGVTTLGGGGGGRRAKAGRGTREEASTTAAAAANRPGVDPKRMRRVAIRNQPVFTNLANSE